MSTYTPLPEIKSTPTGAWRIADGEVRRGRPIDGSVETTEQLYGYLTRISIYEGVTQDDMPFERLEIAILTNDGEQRLGTYCRKPTDGKPSYSVLMTLGPALLQCAKGEPITISAHKSAKPNSYGTFNTYANVSRIDPVTGKKHPIYLRSKEGTATQGKNYDWSESGVQELLDDLREHPAYADRPELESEAEGDPMVAIGWPAFQCAEAEYVELINASMKLSVTDWRELNSEQLNAFVEACSKRKPLKKILDAASAKHTEAKHTEEEDDPFAED